MAKLPRHGLLQFSWGLTYPFRAVGMICRGGLLGTCLRLVMLHLVAMVVLTFLLAGAVWSGIAHLLSAALAWLPESWESWLCGPHPSWLKALEHLLGGPVALIFAGLCIWSVGQSIATPMLERLSSIVQQRELGPYDEAPSSLWSTLDALLMGLMDSLWSLVWLVAFSVPQLLISALVPPVGVVTGVLLTSMWWSQEFLTLPLSRLGLNYRQRWHWMCAHPGLALGFGLGATLLMLVPLALLVMLPVACVGGTLLFCDMQRQGMGFIAAARPQNLPPAP